MLTLDVTDAAPTAEEGTPVSDDEPGYEQARDELARVVAKLEAGGLSLEDSLALWERGESLARTCERHLAGARERVETVLRTAEGGDAAPSGTL